MKEKLIKMWSRISNTPTFLSFLGGVYLFLSTTKIIDIPQTKWDTAVKALSIILISLGVLRNKGGETPTWDDK